MRGEEERRAGRSPDYRRQGMKLYGSQLALQPGLVGMPMPCA